MSPCFGNHLLAPIFLVSIFIQIEKTSSPSAFKANASPSIDQPRRDLPVDFDQQPLVVIIPPKILPVLNSKEVSPFERSSI